MDERKELNAALPADVQAAEPGADAALGRAKKYVKPTMQVFPLGCGLLATSGQPVSVAISFTPLDYYLSDLCIDPVTRCGSLVNPEFCGKTLSEAWGGPAAELTEIRASWVEESLRVNTRCYNRNIHSLDELLAVYDWVRPDVVITGADWDPEDFFQNADIKCDGSGGYYGTYMGQSFTVTITAKARRWIYDNGSWSPGVSPYGDWC
ncbi:MAG: hypothetical protein IJ722_02985 [Alloprevotella sp.]|nr:hypothetical protein [Alloprevotella sp.]